MWAFGFARRSRAGNFRAAARISAPTSCPRAFPIRAIYFDKSPAANWLVPWHQDLTLVLRSHAEVRGFGQWSVKDGVPHVQPPVEVLEQMLTVRLHLDDADESNGALRVLPGSHRLGRLSPGQIQELRARQTDVLCTIAAGDAMLMRPLLLHASGRSTSQRHRRVLHIEYAAFSLPDGLEWHEAA
jgi:ectoine hydroxylase-related dioxygenase (phytanoyl-CoA dioxygenase family)